MINGLMNASSEDKCRNHVQLSSSTALNFSSTPLLLAECDFMASKTLFLSKHYDSYSSDR